MKISQVETELFHADISTDTQYKAKMCISQLCDSTQISLSHNVTTGASRTYSCHNCGKC
jgi:hypothetical protein